MKLAFGVAAMLAAAASATGLPLATPQNDGIVCQACEFAATAAGDFLAKNGTEAKVQDIIVNKVCPLLGNEEGTCTMFAPVVVPKLFSVVERELPQLCTVADLCSSEAEMVPSVEASSAGCSLCKLIAGELEDLLAKNTTIVQIETDLEKLCADLPGSLSDTCQEYVEAYAGTLVQLLEQALPPEKACEIITLCDKPSLKLAPSNDDCSTCEFVLNSAKAYLSDNSTVTEIIDKVVDICNEYAGDYASECSAFAKMYGPDVLTHLATLIDADTDCKDLGFCSSTRVNALAKRPQFLLGRAAAIVRKQPVVVA